GVGGSEGGGRSVTGRINPERAAVVRRIFELYAGGIGTLTIAHRLNKEAVKPPRGRGWAPSGIREMLYRPLYRGEIVWNRTQKIVRAGTKQQRKRDQSEGLTVSAPDLRIIADDLWLRVKERLQRSGAIYARTSRGRLLSRPRPRDESAYLLTGFARCGVCGGTIGTDLRAHGSASSRAHIPHYGCLDHKRRGTAVCTNTVSLNQRLLDQAILAAICALLDEHVLGAAVDRAFSRLTADVERHRTRLMAVERELAGI